MRPSTQRAAAERFRELHAAGCFLLPNPWDAGSARFLEHLGFEAVATTSAGFAFTRGLPDSPDAVPLEAMLGHFREVVAATALPVNADFLNGYADAPDAVAANVRACVGTGVAGLSVEDGTGDAAAPLYPFELAVDRVRAARAAIDSSGIPVVLTARCEAWLLPAEERTRTAANRLVAYAEAGADCLYAPGVADREGLATLVGAVAPRPLNALVSRPTREVTLASLAALGVRRVSVGPALALVAWGAFQRAARAMKEDGTFDFAGPARYDELDALFRRETSSVSEGPEGDGGSNIAS